MVWFVGPRQRKADMTWQLVADSDEGGGFCPCCDHSHATADEAIACEEAQTKAGEVTGFPREARVLPPDPTPALIDLTEIAKQMFDQWDKDMKAGKLLTALAGQLPGYDRRIDRLRAQLAKAPFDLVAHLRRQREFSERTFGPGIRTAGVLDHIRKELREIEADPADISEWVDVVILAFDGAWRAGWEPEAIVEAIVAKQTKNEGRTWPDWRTVAPDKAIEHDRTKDAPEATL